MLIPEEKNDFEAIFGFEWKNKSNEVEQALEDVKALERLIFLASGWTSLAKKISDREKLLDLNINVVSKQKATKNIIIELEELVISQVEIEQIFYEAMELLKKTGSKIKTQKIINFSSKYRCQPKELSIYLTEVKIIYEKLGIY